MRTRFKAVGTCVPFEGRDVYIEVDFDGYHDPGRTYGPAELCYPAEGEVEPQGFELVIYGHKIDGKAQEWRVPIPEFAALELGGEALENTLRSPDLEG